MMNFREIEQKWQKKWFEKKIYEAKEQKGRKFFIHFAYPGISGYLHVGHMRGFTYADIIARYKRMCGYDVIFPAGFHATGLPAVSLAKKVARKDEEILKYLRNNGCPEDVIKKLHNPYEVVKYFSKVYVEDYWKKFGFLIDYTRVMDTVSDGYKKFIQWQFKKLNEKNLLIQKPHFAPYCPNCGPVAVDKSETDISEGGDAEILEFIVIKFIFGDKILPAATLRPETIFGVTNMWVNDEVEYAVVRVGDEKWILSEKAVSKLKYQIDDVEIVGRIHGKDIAGKECFAPIIEKSIPIFPAKFANPDVATGIVMSVPAHAPYDYIALRDIGMPVEPVVIINVPGYEIPAKEIVEKMGIKNQEDFEKLEEATQIIYKEEFHRGIMNEKCNGFEGMKVNDAKEEIKNEMLEKNIADIMREFSKKVVCRCGEEVIIRKVPNQWFIKYSDENLTHKSKEWVEKMNIYPKEYKEELPKILEWYGDRACIRQGSWLGTPFPFDEKWVIEPISDSTLYPAYYIISKYVNEGKIKADEMNDDFFNYIFMGEGFAKNEIWKEIRKEFEYWYPVDINLGGKEHKTVHFPVFIMNHVAIMPEKFYPKGIFVNWWITQKEGVKISKSKGGAEPIPDASENYGVDALRLYYAHVGSPFVDVEWDGEVVEQYKKRILRIWSLFENLIDIRGGEKKIDEWLVSSFNEKIKVAREAMSEYELRKASNAIFFEIYNVINWYIRRGGENRNLIKEILKKWVRAMSPFTPHIAEEMWERMGEKSFVSLERFPEYGDINKSVLKAEELLIKTMEDIEEIKKVAKIEPEKIYIYLAPKWKWEVMDIALSLDKKGMLNMKNLMNEIKKMNVDMKEASIYAGKLVKEIKKEEFLKIDEKEYFEDAIDFLQKEFNAEFRIYGDEECYDPANKRRFAMPYKPAIYME